MKKYKPSGFWSYDKCKETALKYGNRGLLLVDHPGCINAIKRNGWLELFDHMKKKSKVIWTYERCKETALQYKDRKSLIEYSKSCYGLIYQNGWTELFDHMEGRKSKPSGYWTYEKCKEIALKYEWLNVFYEKEKSAYSAIYRNGWLELINHLKKKTTNWTYDSCKEIALQHKTKRSLSDANINCYRTINRNGWLDLFDHMEKEIKIIWTYEKCKEIALKYKNRKLLSDDHPGCTNTIRNNKWLELFDHMETKNYKPRGYWTYEKCKETTLNYEWLPDFNRENKTASSVIMRKGWLELINHLKPRGYRERLIYAYEFKETNSVYVGLTYSIRMRSSQHLTDVKSAVNIHINEHNVDPVLKVLTEYVDQDEAIKLEEFYVNEYDKNGWVILNRAKTGCVGSFKKKWTKEYIFSLIMNCEKYSEMRRILSHSVIKLMKKEKWWVELTSHMLDDDNKWTDERALKYVNSFDTISVLQDKMSGLHKYLKKKPHIKKLFENHWGNVLEEKKNYLGYTKEKCLLVGSKCTSIYDLSLKNRYVYNMCSRNGWFSEIVFKDLKTTKGSLKRPKGYWTYDRCKEISLKYKSRSEFMKNESGCYFVIKYNKWEDLLPPKKNVLGSSHKYTDEMINEICEKSKTRSNLRKNYPGVYYVLTKRNHLDVYFPKKNLSL